MEYLDWEVCLELFKALTPFILALIVYFVWHKQKEKEVIASEAKNLFMKLNELSDHSFKMFMEISEISSIALGDDHVWSKKNIEKYKEILALKLEKLLLFEMKVSEVHSILTFMNNSLDTKELEKLLSDFTKAINEEVDTFTRNLYAPIDDLADIESNDRRFSEAGFTSHNQLIAINGQIKSVILKYALYRGIKISSKIK